MRAHPARGARLAFLAAATFVAGAAVMTLEVVGARVVGAYFGVSLFVWTSLIAVTLLALASGYALGGHLADRHRGADPIFLWIGAAGLLVLGIPWVKDVVLAGTMTLGPRWGAFGSALALFGPPLALLGASSPAIVRQLAHDPGRLAATVGWLAGLSTLGSLCGTLVTGYVLLAHFDLVQILAGTGAMCVALAAAWFALAAGRPLALAALVLPAFALPAPRDVRVELPDGTLARLVDARSGFYGEVRVVEYAFDGRRTREMLIDGLVQGGIDVASGESVYETVPLLQHLPLAHRPGGTRALVVGLGPGLVAANLRRQGLHVDVVEIDPAVLESARRHFGFPADAPVIVDDARHAIARSGGRYDYAVLDVFNGDATPGHLLTVEALRALRARLAPRGVVALNLIVPDARKGARGNLALGTLAAVFPYLQLYPVPGNATESGLANVIAIAATDPIDAMDATPAWLAQVHPMARPGVARALSQAWRWQAGAAARPASDGFNPVDVREATLRDAMRRAIQRGSPSELLLARPPRRD